MTEEPQRFCVMLTAPGTIADDPNSPAGHITNAVFANPKETHSQTPSIDSPPDDKTDASDDAFHDPLMNPKITQTSNKEDTACEDHAKDKNNVNCEEPGTRIFGGLVTFEQVRRGLLGRDMCMPRRILQERVIPMKGPGTSRHCTTSQTSYPGGNGVAEVFTSIHTDQPVAKPVPDQTMDDFQSLPWSAKRLMFLRKGVQSAKGKQKAIRIR